MLIGLKGFTFRSLEDTPAMAIINSINKLLEIPMRLLFTPPWVVYLHKEKKSIKTLNNTYSASTKL